MEGREFAKRAILLLADGLNSLNKNYDLFGIDITDWSEELSHQLITEGSYDEVLDELCAKYKHALGPEEKLVFMLMSSLLMNISIKKARQIHSTEPKRTPQTPQPSMPRLSSPLLNEELLLRLADIRRKLSEDSDESDSRSENSSDWNSTIDGPVYEPSMEGHCDENVIDGYMSF